MWQQQAACSGSLRVVRNAFGVLHMAAAAGWPASLEGDQGGDTGLLACGIYSRSVVRQAHIDSMHRPPLLPMNPPSVPRPLTDNPFKHGATAFLLLLDFGLSRTPVVSYHISVRNSAPSANTMAFLSFLYFLGS